MADRPPMNALPDDVNLSHEAGEALRNRLQANPLTSEDRWRLVKLIQGYCGFTFARCETKSRLRWLKRALLGEGPRPLPTDGGEAWAGADAGLTTAAGGALPAAGSAAPIEEPAGATRAPSAPVRRGGQGRQGADADAGGARVLCRQEELAAGQRGPAGGRGTLYRLPAGVAIRIDGNALLSAGRDELEAVRCAAGGAVFTAPVPGAAGTEKYSPQARAVIALGRDYRGLPVYRMTSIKPWSGYRWPMPRGGSWPSRGPTVSGRYSTGSGPWPPKARSAIKTTPMSGCWRWWPRTAALRRAASRWSDGGCTPPGWWSRRVSTSSAGIARAGRTPAIT